jgi:hypothetical protein
MSTITNNMNKQEIKEIAERTFQAGKNNLPDRLFTAYFEEYYRQMQEDHDVKEDDRLTGVWN